MMTSQISQQLKVIYEFSLSQPIYQSSCQIYMYIYIYNVYIFTIQQILIDTSTINIYYRVAKTQILHFHVYYFNTIPQFILKSFYFIYTTRKIYNSCNIHTLIQSLWCYVLCTFFKWQLLVMIVYYMYMYIQNSVLSMAIQQSLSTLYILLSIL